MKYFTSFVNHFHMHRFISLAPWGDNGHQRISDLCIHHTGKQDLLSQKFATSYILLTNDEYTASLNPLIELKHRAAVRMDFKIDYTQQSAWDANNRSARRFPPLLWKYVHKKSSVSPTLRQMNPVRITLAYFIRVSGILTSTYVPMSKVNTLEYNIHVNSFKHSQKKSVTCHGSPKVSFKKLEWGLQQNLQYLILVRISPLQNYFTRNSSWTPPPPPLKAGYEAEK
jgi:hypothetical protein